MMVATELHLHTLASFLHTLLWAVQFSEYQQRSSLVRIPVCACIHVGSTEDTGADHASHK